MDSKGLSWQNTVLQDYKYHNSHGGETILLTRTRIHHIEILLVYVVLYKQLPDMTSCYTQKKNTSTSRNG